MEVCRLCLVFSKSNSYSKLADPYKCIVNSLIPEVNLDSTVNPFICHQCSNLVNKLHEFKLACFECQQQRKRILFQQGCCHTCLEPIEKTNRPTPHNLKSILVWCLPELGFNFIPDPVVCKKCLVYLQRLQQLKTSYLAVEERLNSFVVKAKRPIDLRNIVHNIRDGKMEFVDDKTCEQQEFEGDVVDNSETKKEWLETEPRSKLDQIMHDVLQRQKEEVFYSCNQCVFTMPNKKHYIMHMLTTHTTFKEESRLIHLCHLCNFQTNYKHQIKRHIEFCHMQKDKLNCPFCSFSSCYALNLRRHISIHEDMQNLTCFHPQCDFKTSYKHSLQRHELKMHKNQCSLCQYKNRTRSLVQKHLRTEHDMYEQFQCDKCKFKTFYLMTLRRHNAKEHKKGLMSKSKFTLIRKTKTQLTAEEFEEVKSLFDDKPL